MTASSAPVRRDGLLIVAGLLIAAGIVGLIAEWADLDLSGWLSGSGWTLFIIVPGLVLVAAGLLLRRPIAGLTIAGTVVTAVGALLLYQDLTDHYESWSYAWALIAPGAVGLGLVLHGLRANDHGQLTVGARMLAIAAAIFVVGAWYFETVFRTGRVPFDLGDSWPIVLVILGAIVLVLAFFGTGERTGPDRPKVD